MLYTFFECAVTNSRICARYKSFWKSICQSGEYLFVVVYTTLEALSPSKLRKILAKMEFSLAFMTKRQGVITVFAPDFWKKTRDFPQKHKGY